MPRGSHDLHGSAPDKSETVLLLIDVINDFDFPEGEQLLRLALPVGHKIAELKKRTEEAAYMRDYKVFVPSDCVVSNTEEENKHALKQMEIVLKADITPAGKLDLKALNS
jgi:nicotinamidase-related amidase